MKKLVRPSGEFLLYGTDDDRTRIECRFVEGHGSADTDANGHIKEHAMSDGERKLIRNRNAKFLIFTEEADELRSADDDKTTSERIT